MKGTSRVVVIDDDDAIREIVQLALSGEGYDVHGERNGADGLDHLARERADVVIVDMKMPVMDGAEFCRSYALQAGPPAHVIVMTAAAERADAARLPGVAATITKPFELDALIEAVARAARGDGRAR